MDECLYFLKGSLRENLSVVYRLSVISRTALEAMKALGNKVDFYLDGGTCAGGVPSTVVDTTKTPFRVLRQGALVINIERNIT